MYCFEAGLTKSICIKKQNKKTIHNIQKRTQLKTGIHKRLMMMIYQFEL